MTTETSKLNRERLAPGRHRATQPRKVTEAIAAKSRQDRADSHMPMGTGTARPDRIFESRAADGTLTMDAETHQALEEIRRIKDEIRRTEDELLEASSRKEDLMREIVSGLAQARADRRAVADGQTFVQRWGEQVAAAGFTSVPNYLLSINQFMDKNHRLSSTELLVLLQILSYWWYANQLPFPSKSIISKRLGLSPRQVQRALNGLEQKELIERVARFSSDKGRRTSNSYHMTRLIDKVRNLAAQHPAAFRSGARVKYNPEIAPPGNTAAKQKAGKTSAAEIDKQAIRL
jgi:DNA-binding MarR family transcriptional regulator